MNVDLCVRIEKGDSVKKRGGKGEVVCGDEDEL